MAAWYPVTKKIKGHSYLYLQRSRREGKHVRTENVYIGPVFDSARSGIEGIRRTVAYHGAREGIEGDPRPSEQGNYGPGLYLGDRQTASDYASFDPRDASDRSES